MRELIATLGVLLVGLPMVAATVADEGQRPNVLLLCIDDLRPELASFGKDYIQSPNIDRLATGGRAFHHHYVQAPTCGASRYTLLTGQYGPSGNGALFARAKKIRQTPKLVSPSLPAWFQKHGYTTVSVGKVSHHPGGRGDQIGTTTNPPEMPHSWNRHLLPAGPGSISRRHAWSRARRNPNQGRRNGRASIRGGSGFDLSRRAHYRRSEPDNSTCCTRANSRSS